MTKKTPEDLLKAAYKADYKAIKECLDDGVPVNYRGHFNPIVPLLCTAAGNEKNSDTQAMECIKLLYENGANLNQFFGDGEFEIFHTPLDKLKLTVTSENPKALHNAVKFVLTHGGKCERFRDDVIKTLEGCGAMSKEEFEKFEEIGSYYYMLPKQKQAEFDFEHPEKSIRDIEIDRNRDERKKLRAKGAQFDASYPFELKWYQELALMEAEADNLENIKKAQELIDKMSKELKEKKEKILKKLHHDKDRDDKAEELKQVMRERDASGSKKTLRAFLKEKTQKAQVKKQKEND